MHKKTEHFYRRAGGTGYAASIKSFWSCPLLSHANTFPKVPSLLLRLCKFCSSQKICVLGKTVASPFKCLN